MTIDTKCTVCRNADRRRLIELGWNGGMGAETMAHVLEGVSSHAILKHLKEHTDGIAAVRLVDVEPEKPMRERVLNIQRMQVEEVERRIALAKQRADEQNAIAIHQTDEHGNPVPLVDWSQFYDILSKDAQQAINTILKTQGLTDKREKVQGELRLGLFESMAKAGLAPKALVGGIEVPALQSGEEIEGEVVDD